MLETARPEHDPRRVIQQVIAGAWRWHFGDFCPSEAWSPAINVYRLSRRLDVCVSLAGVDREAIDVRVEPGRLIIRGIRESPEPKHDEEGRQRILVMEIEHGPFCREISIPADIDLKRVSSDYTAGLLWIHLPMRDQA